MQGKSFTYVGTRVLDVERAGQPAFHMALDGISLRKLPWGDGWSWMQDYLTQEKALFEGRIAAAAATVRTLADAIERFRVDLEEYPQALDELLDPPARLSDRSGRWPYVPGPRIPLDPWGQHYRYAVPGTRNPAGFDVWSVHGNERRPAGWIGNWGERSDQ
jgi:hypothetical protein